MTSSIKKALVAMAIIEVIGLGAAWKSTRHPAATASTSPIRVTWAGHATFDIVSSGGTEILIDPYLNGNPLAPDSLKSATRYHPAAILVSHSHFDHTSDVKAIALASGAPVVSAGEWLPTLGLPEKQQMGVNVGGTLKFGDVIVHVVPAMHSSEPSGRPLGFVLEFADGRTLYHTGDTWIFGDMSLIQELYHPNIILLGVGGGPYGEDPKVAKLAIAKYFHPDVIVPMHFATFPVLVKDADVHAAFDGDKRVVFMHPGETRTF